MIRIIFSLFFMMTFALQADMEQYFKKALHKEGDHHFGNIDFVYLINLDKRPEKFQRSIAQLIPYGINPYRFSAVNGWDELSPEALNEIGLKFAPGMTGGYLGTCYSVQGNNNSSHQVIDTEGKTYFCHCLSKGAIGCAMSHLSILQDAYDSGYQVIWVLEDDIEVLMDPVIIPKLIDQLDSLVGRAGWDILFTDKDMRNSKGEYVPCFRSAKKPNYPVEDPNRFLLRHQISSDLRAIGARFGAHSMIINRQGIRKLLDYFKTYKLFLPYDIEYFMPRDIKLFSTNYDIVNQLSDAISDNGNPNYLSPR